MSQPVSGCILYLLCLLAAGYGTFSAVELLTLKKSDETNLSPLERFGLAACLGPGITGMILIALSMLGHRPVAGAIFAIGMIGAPIAIAGIFIRHKKMPRRPRQRLAKWMLALAILAFGYAILSAAADVLVYPPYQWDAFSIWQLKAKVLANEPLEPRPAYFTNVSMSYSVLRYPLLIPMISAGVHTMTGQLDDELGQSPYLLMYFGLCAAMFAAARRLRGPAIAVIVTALMMTVPNLLWMAVTGTADFSLTAFYGCSLICLLRWQQHHRASDLILAAFFTLFMAWSKNEGSALAAINVAVLWLFTGRPLQIRHILISFAFALFVGILFLPCLLFIRGIPITTVDYLTQIRPGQMLAHLDRLPTILAAMVIEPANLWSWGLFWYLLIILAIVDRRRLFVQPMLMMWVLLLAHFGAYVAPFLVTQLSLQVLFQVTLPRLLVHLLPAAALLMAMHWPQKSQISDGELTGLRAHPTDGPP